MGRLALTRDRNTSLLHRLEYNQYQTYRAMLARRRFHEHFKEACAAFLYVHESEGEEGTAMISLYRLHAGLPYLVSWPADQLPSTPRGAIDTGHAGMPPTLITTLQELAARRNRPRVQPAMPSTPRNAYERVATMSWAGPLPEHSDTEDHAPLSQLRMPARDRAGPETDQDERRARPDRSRSRSDGPDAVSGPTVLRSNTGYVSQSSEE